MLAWESAQLNIENVKRAVGTIMSDEKAVRVFCAALLAIDKVEVASGDDSQNRPFVTCATRIAIVYYKHFAPMVTSVSVLPSEANETSGQSPACPKPPADTA